LQQRQHDGSQQTGEAGGLRDTFEHQGINPAGWAKHVLASDSEHVMRQ
jgi:hypothetical protein